MIGVVIPARDEELTIDACVRSVARAGAHPALLEETVVVIVVCDRCQDATEAIASQAGAVTLACDAGCAGAARHLGARAALALGARWLCFTDADSQVGDEWLVEHLSCDADLVCGTVTVEHWEQRHEHLSGLYAQHYHDGEGHRHVHGANLGISATLYRELGGFPLLASGEDVALVEKASARGARIAWTAGPRVATSARHDPRAPGGFGAYLNRLETALVNGAAVPIRAAALLLNRGAS